MRNTFNRALRVAAAALLLSSSAPATAQNPITTRCDSAAIFAQYLVFSETGRMSPELARFLNDPVLQKMEPYKAFDNVYYVGVCWVGAWLVTSPRGHVLIDALYGGFTDTLVENVRTLGFDPRDIKLVAITHGHRDHAGGAAKLKQVLQPGTRFAMSAEGWREAAETAAASTGTPNAWTMIERDVVMADGQTVSGGDITLQSFDTPGHTMGTVSFAFDARDGARTWRAFTIGGLGLNAVKGPEQVEAYIASVKRIRSFIEDKARPIDFHLPTHPFITGLTEAKDLLKARKPGEPHPLVDLPGFRRQLDELQNEAEKRLVVERQKKAS
jgi:metallo-beta-lactamase class B